MLKNSFSRKKDINVENVETLKGNNVKSDVGDQRRNFFVPYKNVRTTYRC